MSDIFCHALLIIRKRKGPSIKDIVLTVLNNGIVTIKSFQRKSETKKRSLTIGLEVPLDQSQKRICVDPRPHRTPL